MGKIFTRLLRFVVHNFINFIIIAAMLAFGGALYDEAKDKLVTLFAYESWRDTVDSAVKERREAAIRGAQHAANSAQTLIEARIRAIEKEIVANHDLRRGLAISPRGFIEKQKIDITNSYLTQEKEHLALLLARAQAMLDRDAAVIKLETLRNDHVIKNNAYLVYQPTYQKCKNTWHRCEIPVPHYKDIKDENDRLHRENNQAHEEYQRQLAIVNSLSVPNPPSFVPNDAEVGKLKNDLNAEIEKIKDHWLIKAVELLKAVACQALVILSGVILTPLVIKAVLYFAMAPYAARRPAICLLPDTNTAPDLAQQTGKISTVSVDIPIGNGEELLIHQDFLQSSPDVCRKDMKWVLNCSFPLTSLAAGLYGLLRFRSDSAFMVVAAPQADSLAEIGIVDIAEGCAMVFEPHNLIGVVQRIEKPMRVRSKWRLFSSTAWLNLQFRYLVFHGPARLVVQGSRGVKLEQASAGRIINQGATMGYSANLNHSVQRSEVIWPYLWGKEELLNDRFDGAGVFVYAESPFLGKKHGLFGRGIEGLTDSVLKIFGV